jgi:hypothetical protein
MKPTGTSTPHRERRSSRTAHRNDILSRTAALPAASLYRSSASLRCALSGMAAVARRKKQKNAKRTHLSQVFSVRNAIRMCAFEPLLTVFRRLAAAK